MTLGAACPPLWGNGLRAGRWRCLLLRDLGDGAWECLVKPGRKMRLGQEVRFGDGVLTATVTGVQEDGNRVVQFHYQGIFLEILEKLGKTPLPPYIKEEPQDQERYQTVYSRALGSAAAPTAGLHFTQELLEKIRKKGVEGGLCHPSCGPRYLPSCEIRRGNGASYAQRAVYAFPGDGRFAERNQEAGRPHHLWGTTSCRTLESLVGEEDGSFSPGSKWTDIFIYPGYRFRAMDALITNFHLPESTLVMLVSAFAGRGTS